MTGTVNDAQSTWTDMWRAQIRMGIVPRTMTIQHVTGPARHYQVPLARAQQIFARAYASVSGLARTVRGPAMHDAHGFLSIDGTTRVGAEKMFMLRYLQARDPQIAARPFFAAFDPAATWLTDLRPVPGASSDTAAAGEDASRPVRPSRAANSNNPPPREAHLAAPAGRDAGEADVYAASWAATIPVALRSFLPRCRGGRGSARPECRAGVGDREGLGLREQISGSSAVPWHWPCTAGGCRRYGQCFGGCPLPSPCSSPASR